MEQVKVFDKTALAALVGAYYSSVETLKKAETSKSESIAELARGFAGKLIDGYVLYAVVENYATDKKARDGFTQALRMAMRRIEGCKMSPSLDEEHKSITLAPIKPRGAGAGRKAEASSGKTQAAISAGATATDETPEGHAKRLADVLDKLLTDFVGSEGVIIADAVIAVLKKHNKLL